METQVYRIFGVPLVPSMNDESYRAAAQSEASVLGPPTDPLTWIQFWDAWVAAGTRCEWAFLLAAAGTRWNLYHATMAAAPMLYTPTHALIALFHEAFPLVNGAAKLTALDILDEVDITRPPGTAQILRNIALNHFGEYAFFAPTTSHKNPAKAARLAKPYHTLRELARQNPDAFPIAVRRELLDETEPDPITSHLPSLYDLETRRQTPNTPAPNHEANPE